MNTLQIANCQLGPGEQGHFEVKLMEKLVVTIDCYDLMSWILDRDLAMVNYMLKTMSKDDSAKKWILELDSLGYEFKGKIEEFITDKETNSPGWIYEHTAKEDCN